MAEHVARGMKLVKLRFEVVVRSTSKEDIPLPGSMTKCFNKGGERLHLSHPGSFSGIDSHTSSVTWCLLSSAIALRNLWPTRCCRWIIAEVRWKPGNIILVKILYRRCLRIDDRSAFSATYTYFIENISRRGDIFSLPDQEIDVLVGLLDCTVKTTTVPDMRCKL